VCDKFTILVNENKSSNVTFFYSFLQYTSLGDLDTIILIDLNKDLSYTHSDAIFHILYNTKGMYKIISVFFKIPILSKLAYIIFAKWRHKISKKDFCEVNSSLMNHFLNESEVNSILNQRKIEF